jgi:hypothetical protein
MTNAARAEVEQTLDWARAQATAIVARAQQGAEQLLTAAGLGPEALADVANAIVAAANAAAETARARAAAPPQGGAETHETPFEAIDSDEEPAEPEAGPAPDADAEPETDAERDTEPEPGEDA